MQKSDHTKYFAHGIESIGDYRPDHNTQFQRSLQDIKPENYGCANTASNCISQRHPQLPYRKDSGYVGVAPGTRCQGYTSDAALFNSNCYSHTPTENIAIYFYICHHLHSKLTKIVECWHGLSSERMRERCLNGAASPRSKCVEGMLPFLTNTAR